MPADSHPEIVPTTVQDVQAALTESLEPPTDAVPSTADTPSAAPVVAEPASDTLPPDSPEGRINAAYTTGRVIDPEDVRGLEGRYAPDVIQQVYAVAASHNWFSQEEAKLVAAVPAWKDTKRGRAEIAQLADFLKSEYHVSDEQIKNAFVDSRAILLARDAMRARQRDQQAPTVGRRASRSTGGHVFGTAPGERLAGSPSASAAIRALLE